MSAAQIVLIEDSPADVMLIDLALKETGISYELTTFVSGREALACFCPPEGTTTDPPKPDAIFLDLNTPKSDGFEVLRILKQCARYAHVPIAIISSSPLGDKGPALVGANRYIQKPSDLDEFFATVGQATREMLALR